MAVCDESMLAARVFCGMLTDLMLTGMPSGVSGIDSEQPIACCARALGRELGRTREGKKKNLVGFLCLEISK